MDLNNKSVRNGSVLVIALLQSLLAGGCRYAITRCGYSYDAIDIGKDKPCVCAETIKQCSKLEIGPFHFQNNNNWEILSCLLASANAILDSNSASGVSAIMPHSVEKEERRNAFYPRQSIIKQFAQFAEESGRVVIFKYGVFYLERK